MEPPPYFVAVLGSVLLTGTVAPIVAPRQPQTAPGLKPPAAPRGTRALPQIIPVPNPSGPNMTSIPKSHLVSGLKEQGGHTFFTGPNGGIVLGPMSIRIVPCSAAVGTVVSVPPVTVPRTAQRR